MGFRTALSNAAGKLVGSSLETAASGPAPTRDAVDDVEVATAEESSVPVTRPRARSSRTPQAVQVIEDNDLPVDDGPAPPTPDIEPTIEPKQGDARNLPV